MFKHGLFLLGVCEVKIKAWGAGGGGGGTDCNASSLANNAALEEVEEDMLQKILPVTPGMTY